MITLVTCTRNRPLAFSLLEKWIARQHYKDYQWLVINDSLPEVQREYKYTMGQKVIRRKYVETPPLGNVMVLWEGAQQAQPLVKHNHSLCQNWLCALKHIKGNAAVCIEDDDYYAPGYLSRIAAMLEQADLVGLNQSLYVNIRYRKTRRLGNHSHCSLACTAFRSPVLPLLRAIAERGNPFIDIQLWSEWKGSRLIEKNWDGKRPLQVGIKGMEGEPGISEHNHTGFEGQPDPRCLTLREWIGRDADEYLALEFPEQ